MMMRYYSLKTDQIKAIVFDLDDTLYPQVSYKRSGFRVVAAWLADNLGLAQSTVYTELESILHHYGAAYPKMFDRLVERLGMRKDVVVKLVRAFVEHEPAIGCYEGVLPLLNRLRAKYHLGILTDGRYDVQQKKISALGLKNYVDEILCSDSIGLEKPAMQLYAWFEEKFQISGEKLMYVGDNPGKDFLGANKRKWTTVRVMTGDCDKRDLPSDFQAHFEIPAVESIERLLVP